MQIAHKFPRFIFTMYWYPLPAMHTFVLAVVAVDELMIARFLTSRDSSLLGIMEMRRMNSEFW